MENLIFRRDEEETNEPVTGSLKEISNRRRKNMTALHELFSETEKTKLVKKVFNRDPELYTNFLKRLETRQTWQEAHQMMEEELYRQQVDLYSKEARILTDKVYRIFFPEDL